MIRQGGGGLEHSNSTLLTSSPKATEPTRRWLSFVAHEYFHAFNVKRLRPVELGPFDYEKPPTYDELVALRGRHDVFRGPDARAIGRNHPRGLSRIHVIGDCVAAEVSGPPEQSLEQSSAEVWTNSNSASAPTDDGELLRQGQRRLVPARRARPAAHQRQAIHGRRDAARVRAIWRRTRLHGRRAPQDGRRGRGPGNEGVVREIDREPGELDYGEMLGWYGLRFSARTPAERAGSSKSGLARRLRSAASSRRSSRHRVR